MIPATNNAHIRIAAGALVIVLAAAAIAQPAHAQDSGAPLSLAEAVQIAVSADDPALARFDAHADALEELAVADAQLPDPTLRGSLSNFPTDSFRYDQEAMTQVLAGLRQEFPAGRTLAVRGERRRAEAAAARAGRELALREIERDVRMTWLDLYAASAGARLVEDNHRVVRELIGSLAASFGAGRLNAQNVLRAELELSLLDDRLAELSRRGDAARADLARYLGPDAARPLPAEFPKFATPRDLGDMVNTLTKHPAVHLEDAKIAVADHDVTLAEQAYRPTWALEGGYGFRGGGRADLASIGVTVSLPLFAESRQDRRRSAAVRQSSAQRLDRAAMLLDLKSELERSYADWVRLGERVSLYQDAVIKRANETAKASVSSYANGRTDFPEVIRAQLAELDSELVLLDLRISQAKAWNHIDYLFGDFQ